MLINIVIIIVCKDVSVMSLNCDLSFKGIIRLLIALIRGLKGCFNGGHDIITIFNDLFIICYLFFVTFITVNVLFVINTFLTISIMIISVFYVFSCFNFDDATKITLFYVFFIESLANMKAA